MTIRTRLKVGQSTVQPDRADASTEDIRDVRID